MAAEHLIEIDSDSVRAHAHVTSSPAGPYGVRMRTVDWDQRAQFMAYLRDLRVRAGFRNDAALADAAGVSHTTLSSWRTGRQKPSLDGLQRIADALGVPAHTLAEQAGVVDPARFGRTAPTGDVEELSKILQEILDMEELSDEDRDYFIARARADWEAEQEAARERARDRTVTRLEEWRRLRGA